MLGYYVTYHSMAWHDHIPFDGTILNSLFRTEEEAMSQTLNGSRDDGQAVWYVDLPDGFWDMNQWDHEEQMIDDFYDSPQRLCCVWFDGQWLRPEKKESKNG